jgi:hypothetical protein
MIFLDDRVTRHPKVLDAGVAARTLWLNAICWAAQYRTGGHVTTEQLAACIAHELGELRMPGPDGRLRKATVPGLIERLVRSGLLEVVAEGVFQIHDFEAYQRTQPAAPTVEALEQTKKVRNEKLSAAGLKGALARWGKAAREAIAPDGQAMPEAIGGHDGPAWPSGSPSLSQTQKTNEENQPPPSDGLMASLDGQAIGGHGHEAMPMAMREREGAQKLEEKRAEPVSEVRLKVAPPVQTDADVFEETMQVVLGNPAWTFNRRLPSNLEALRAVMGWFDAADLKDLPDRRQAMGRVLNAFTMWLARPEQSRRTLDPPHLRDFLDTHEEHRPRKLRPSAPKSPAKAHPPPPPDLALREDILSFSRNFGRGMPA